MVADATVLAAAVFGEDEQAQAVALLRGRALAAPHLADCEMTSVGLKKLRREQHPREAVTAALESFAALPIERHPIDPAAVFALADRYSLTACDAAYLWLAERLEAPLATFDAKLAQAARKHLIGHDDDTA